MAFPTLAMLALMSVGATATLTSNEQTLILNRHNKLRSETARKANLPKGNADHLPCTASDMEKMTWSTKLATEAQTYADKCIGDHPAGAGSEFGENLWMLISSDAYVSTDLESGVQEWYDEIVDTVWKIDDPKGPQSKPVSDCKDVSGDTCNVGHYYQTIWAASNQVGCGVKKCSSGMTVQGTPYDKGAIMVCRYQSPASLGAGITHTPPFLFGKACAACPDSCEDGLCTKAPTRCLDKTNIKQTVSVGGTAKVYTDCASIVAAKPNGMDWCTQLAPLMDAEGDCPKSCKKCTVPANIGTEFCGAPTSLGTKTETKTEDTKTTDTKTGDNKTETTKTGDTKTGDTKTETKTGDTKTETKTEIKTNGTSGTSGSNSTVTAATADVVITGDLTLVVPDADAFLNDTDAQDAVKSGIAATAGVPASQVALTVTKTRRLTEGRSLAGTGVKVTYTITVPKASGKTVQDSVQKVMKDATVEALTQNIALKIVAKKGASYTVSVASKSAVTATAAVPAPAEGQASNCFRLGVFLPFLTASGALSRYLF